MQGCRSRRWEDSDTPVPPPPPPRLRSRPLLTATAGAGPLARGVPFSGGASPSSPPPVDPSALAPPASPAAPQVPSRPPPLQQFYYFSYYLRNRPRKRGCVSFPNLNSLDGFRRLGPRGPSGSSAGESGRPAWPLPETVGGRGRSLHLRVRGLKTSLGSRARRGPAHPTPPVGP